MPRKSNLSKLAEMTAQQLKAMGEKETLKAYETIAKEVRKRRREFKRAGRLDKFRQDLQGGLESPEGLTQAEMKETISSILAYFRGKPSTLSGWEELHAERLETLRTRFGLESLSDEEFEKYGEFMGEMQEKYGDDWGFYSAEAQKMAVEALESGDDDLSQFVKNFDYWTENTAQKMKEYKSIKKRAKNLGVSVLEVQGNAKEWLENPEKMAEAARERKKGRKSAEKAKGFKLPKIFRRWR